MKHLIKILAISIFLVIGLLACNQNSYYQRTKSGSYRKKMEHNKNI
jgi:hypothetical protein